jgi:DNA polymerase III delta prime subunit
MNDFIEFNEPTLEKTEHYIWSEKYRPTKLEDYIGDDVFKDKLKKIIDTGELNHLIFHGSNSGTGKTTAAKFIAKNLKCDWLLINASDENGIDDVRNKIKSFAATASFSELKIVICDEADFLSPSAMASLRHIIEQYSLTTRFIFTCNYIEKIIPALISRCQLFEVLPSSKKDVAIHLKNILNKEKVESTVDDIGYIVNTYYPDIRKILTFAQNSVVDGALKVVKTNSTVTDINSKIVELLKSPNPSTFNAIRQIVADNSIKHFEDLYNVLFSQLDSYAKNNQTIIILILAEYVYQSSLVVNKEISFMACIAKILKEL